MLVGAALAARDGYRRPGLAFLFWLFAGCVQIGTNLHNDYADFVRGADTSARVGQARAAQKGWLTPAAVCWGTCTVLSVAAIIGGALAAGVAGAARPAMPMTVVTATSVFNAFAYTGGPFPLGCDFLRACTRRRAHAPRLRAKLRRSRKAVVRVSRHCRHILLRVRETATTPLAEAPSRVRVIHRYFGLVATCAPYWLQSGGDLARPHVLSAAVPIGMLATAVRARVEKQIGRDFWTIHPPPARALARS